MNFHIEEWSLKRKMPECVDDLIYSIPNKVSGSPGVGKMILKVAFTHPEIKAFLTVALSFKKPEDTNPVPGVEVLSVLYPHCVHN